MEFCAGGELGERGLGHFLSRLGNRNIGRSQTHDSCASHGTVGLRRELNLQRGLRLDLAEKNMSKEKVAVRGVWMAF